MPSYGRTSRSRLESCHEDLQAIFNAVILEADCSILCGERSQEAQTLAFDLGNSRVQWPDSLHNKKPSMAVDVALYHKDIEGHIDWNNKQEFCDFSELVRKVADDLLWAGQISHKLRWGGDWDGDGVPVFMDDDESLWDAPHYELEEE